MVPTAAAPAAPRSLVWLSPALSSTLWAVGCQLRMPTRLECPSSLTTGSLSGAVSPPSGISQICPAGGSGVRQEAARGRSRKEVRRGSYHDAAVLGAAGDDVVVVGAELDVQDGPRVAAHGRVAHVDPARLHARAERVSSQLGMSGESLAGEESLGMLAVLPQPSAQFERLIKIKIKIKEDRPGFFLFGV